MAPRATIIDVVRNNPHFLTAAVDAAAPIIPPRFKNTPVRVASAAGIPDETAIIGAQLLSRYKTSNMQNALNMTQAVASRRPSATRARIDDTRPGPAAESTLDLA